MRPPVSVSLEPGLDRGVPWGRDLFTFVTSAAGHMMRTLQKPRKNRPSKRQVNHRRFLHNMIQRKFADIEAANHRLASSLYSKNDDPEIPTVSDKPETPDDPGIPPQRETLQDPDMVHKESDDLYKPSSTLSSDVNDSKGQTPHNHKPSLSSHRTEEQSDAGHKGAESGSTSFPKEIDTFQLESYNGDISVDDVSEETQTALNESSVMPFEVNTSPFFSPQLSPLSLDLCDFSIQVCADKSAYLMRNIADTTEGQMKDIIDPLSVDTKNLGVGSEVEDYFDSIFGCHGDAEVTEQSSGFPEVEAGPYEGAHTLPLYGYCSHEGHVLSTDLCQSSLQGERHSAPEEGQSGCRRTDLTPSLFLSDQQTCSGPQENPTACRLMNCHRNLNFTPFEGVAQSFSAPIHHHWSRPISTPPPEDDWPFTDILKDTTSPDF